MSVPHLSNIELGHKEASPEMLDAIARALGIRVEEVRTKRNLLGYLQRVQDEDDRLRDLEPAA